ncbi:hypothetical protein CI610_03677 [invertebrate metagenome]|uniref:Uncharacterized protein n=1 Tax=invertebrate metagenome TaxID=1711999 RepID=A0A2H9T2F4_9ZZZZ
MKNGNVVCYNLPSTVTQNNMLTLSSTNTCNVKTNNTANKSASKVAFHGSLNTMFSGNIHGGTFHISINSREDEDKHKAVKRRRTMVLYDSDSE